MREPASYRQQLEFLSERYPNQELLSIQEACRMFSCGRRKLLADKTFPAKQIGGKGKYYIPIPGLAWWMASK